MQSSLLFGQYLNQINETPNDFEFTYNYLLDNQDSLVSTGAVTDSNVSIYGWNYISFKKYDGAYNVINENRISDSSYLYGSFYGLSNFKESYFHCGARTLVGGDTTEGCLFKHNIEGDLLWIRRLYPNYESTKVTNLINDDTLIYTLSNTRNPSISQFEMKLSAIDTSGTILWDKTFAGNGEQGYSISKDDNNGFIISAHTQTGGYQRSLVYKLDSIGNVNWSKWLGPSVRNHLVSMVQLPSGNYLGYGFSESVAMDTTYGRLKAWFIELDELSGNIIVDTTYWLTPFYSGFNTKSNIILENDRIIVTGVLRETSSGSGVNKAFIASFDYGYNLLWIRNYFPRETEQLIYNVFEANNFYYCQGLTSIDSSSDSDDEWFLIVDSLGCDDQWCSVGVGEYHSRENLVSVYPNPNNGEFWLELNEKLYKGDILITDLSGRTVAHSTINKLSRVSLSYLNNGLYILSLELDGKIIESHRVVIQH